MEKWKAFKQKEKELADKAGYSKPDAKEKLAGAFKGQDKDPKNKFAFTKIKGMFR